MGSHLSGARAGVTVGAATALLAVAGLAGAAGGDGQSRAVGRVQQPVAAVAGQLPVATAHARPAALREPDLADAAAPVSAQVRPTSSVGTTEVLALVRQYFPADQVGNAMAVARCESGHSNAIGATNNNGTTDWGVFQLNDGGTLQGALRRIGTGFTSTAEAQQLALDAETNVRAARAIYDNRGWAPWVCAYKTGIVAALYSSTPGPMAGRYDEQGTSGVSFTVEDAPPDPPAPSASPKPEPGSPSPAGPATAAPSPKPSSQAHADTHPRSRRQPRPPHPRRHRPPRPRSSRSRSRRHHRSPATSSLPRSRRPSWRRHDQPLPRMHRP